MSGASSPLSSAHSQVKQEDVHNNDNSVGPMKSEDAEEEPTLAPASSVPTTPKGKAGSLPKTHSSGSKRGADGSDDEEESPVKKTKGRATPKNATPGRQRKAPANKPTPAKAIATTMDDLSSEDHLLITMKDQGKNWEEIRAAWKAATGQSTAKSTLPNRYSRLKANLTTMSEEDQDKLILAKKYVEEEHERTKWEQISQYMNVELGTATKYSTSILQKQFKKMGDADVATPTRSAAKQPADDSDMEE